MRSTDRRPSRAAVRIWLTSIIAVPAVVIAVVLVARFAPPAFVGSGPDAMVDRYITSMDEASDRLLEIEAWDERTREEFDAYFCSDVESNVRAQLDPTERWTDFYDVRGIQYRFTITLVELVEQDDQTIAVLRWEGSLYWYEEKTEQREYRVEMRKGGDGWCFAALVDPIDAYLG